MKYYDGYFKELKNEIVQWIRDWFDQNGPGCNAIVGISGGKDSSVVAALCVEALGKDRVIGVLMPQGQQKDICTCKFDSIEDAIKDMEEKKDNGEIIDFINMEARI